MNGIQWTVAQSRRLDLPCGAGAALLSGTSVRDQAADAVDRNAEWVISLQRPVTWVEVVEHLGCHRYYAMRLLRVGAERGLLRSTASPNPKRPDLFEGR